MSQVQGIGDSGYSANSEFTLKKEQSSDRQKKTKCQFMAAGVSLAVILIAVIIIMLVTENRQSKPKPQPQVYVNKLVFVSEIVRHGARAPELVDPTHNGWGFKVSDGQLTPMGMRQRHLLGRYHQNKYKHEENFKELVSGIVAKHLHVDSTDYYRTIQSVYSQLHGLQFVSGNSKAITITKEQSQALKSPTPTQSVPRFAVRNIASLSETSNQQLEHNYIQVPVFSWISPQSSDPMQMQACDFANKVGGKRYGEPTIPYVDYMWIMNDCKAGYRKQLQLNDTQFNNMNFRASYSYGDIIFAQEFANQTQVLQRDYKWTYLQNQEVDLTQIVGLTADFTNKARNLFASKNFIEPITDIKDLWKNKDTTNIPKYRIYSAHDFQIANLMIAIKPDFELNVVPYASTIKFELYKNGFGKYSVTTIYNGQQLRMGNCKVENCPIENWFEYLDNHLTTDPAELHQKCSEVPTAQDYENDETSDWHFNQTIKTEALKKNAQIQSQNLIEMASRRLIYSNKVSSQHRPAKLSQSQMLTFI